jgi:hypothetical protein
MKKLILLALLVVAGAVYAANYANYIGTQNHTAGVATGSNNRQDSTDIWIGPSEGYSTILSTVTIMAGQKDGLILSKRNFGVADSAIVRIITKGNNFGTSIIRSSAMALTIPKTVIHDTICNDTTFKGYIGIRVITADTLSDTTIANIIYPVSYEVILK